MVQCNPVSKQTNKQNNKDAVHASFSVTPIPVFNFSKYQRLKGQAAENWSPPTYTSWQVAGVLSAVHLLKNKETKIKRVAWAAF